LLEIETNVGENGVRLF